MAGDGGALAGLHIAPGSMAAAPEHASAWSTLNKTNQIQASQTHTLDKTTTARMAESLLRPLSLAWYKSRQIPTAARVRTRPRATACYAARHGAPRCVGASGPAADPQAPPMAAASMPVRHKT